MPQNSAVRQTSSRLPKRPVPYLSQSRRCPDRIRSRAYPAKGPHMPPSRARRHHPGTPPASTVRGSPAPATSILIVAGHPSQGSVDVAGRRSLPRCDSRGPALARRSSAPITGIRVSGWTGGSATWRSRPAYEARCRAGVFARSQFGWRAYLYARAPACAADFRTAPPLPARLPQYGSWT